MSVLVENWPPVAVYGEVNLIMVYSGVATVDLGGIDGTAPAYVPVYELNAGGSVVGQRMAMLAPGAEIAVVTTAAVGMGGLDAGVVAADTGYDVYLLVKDDLSEIDAIACVHGAVLTKPAGWGHRYASAPLRYICCNAGAADTDIQPFVEVAPRLTYYAGIGADVQILSNDQTAIKEVIALRTPPGALRKAQFPTTARKVIVQICAANNDNDPVGELALYLAGAATPVYTLDDLGTNAGNCVTKTTTMIVPCHSGRMDTDDLMKEWITGTVDVVSVDVFALGYQL